ncbi:MAG: acyl-CoA dehydratase activase-related protein [Clostridia bacterium]|nr:acyl-CoA dehydratase activase-related protein [Clostridia bacterium]
MKIGIPKAMITYEYPVLYHKFFELLGVQVVYSDETNSNILNDGIIYSIDETCLANKIYMGHVANLVKRSDKENIDYIFIPRVAFFDKKETVCVKFYALYDICKNIFDAHFITVNIDYSCHETEFKAFVNLGIKLGFSFSKTILAYKKAKKLQQEYDKANYEKQIKALSNKNILLVAHPYIEHDQYMGYPVVKFLKDNQFNVIYSDINNGMQTNNESYKELSKYLYWKYNKNLLNGIIEYSEKVDGIIFISTFPCGPDAMVNDLVIRKVKDKPILNLVVDEQDGSAGLYTRLESFIDILEQNKEEMGERI